MSSTRSHGVVRVGVFGALLFLAPAARGEEAAGGLRGNVFQRVFHGATSERADLPFANVFLIRDDTGETQMYVCGEEGRFTFPGLAPGAYRLEARLEGYRSTRATVEVAAGRVATANLTLSPGVDLEETLERLRPEQYESLIFQVYAPRQRTFRLDVVLEGTESRVMLSAEVPNLGEGTFERRLSPENLSRLHRLLEKAEPFSRNHRGSYARPPDLPYETLEVVGAGVVAVIVVSGNPDFEEGPGRELIEFLYGLPDTLVKRVGKGGEP